MAVRPSDKIRAVVLQSHIRPSLLAGKRSFSVRVRDVLTELDKDKGFTSNRTPLVCAVLQGKRFLEKNGLAIERVDGPASKQSPTVVVHYTVKRNDMARTKDSVEEAPPLQETSDEWAARMTGKLRGLLREEIAALGGAAGFMKWVRSDHDGEEAE